MTRPPVRTVDASRLYLAGMVVATVGCLVQLLIALGHAPPALDLLSLAAGGFAIATALGAWIAEQRWRWRTAEALTAAVAALMIGPLLSHVHQAAVVAAFIASAVVLADGVRPTGSSRSPPPDP